jgi:acyl-coenzyme A synthetase/AMP-(fatty) acid ligase
VTVVPLHELLDATRDNAVRVCVDGTAILDLSALKQCAYAYTQRLRSASGKRYALCLDDPFEFASALLAVLATGNEAVIPANSTPGYLAELGGAYDVLLVDGGRESSSDAQENVHIDAATISLGIDPRAPLTLYTSGSSGVPKPVKKTLAQFDAEVRTLEAQWGAQLGAATIFASVPHRHIYGLLFRLFWPLAAGRPFDRATCTEPRELAQRLAQRGRGVLVSSPAQLSRWLELPGVDEIAAAPCVFFSSGAPLAEATALGYARHFGAAPVEIYGSTETGGIAWRQQHADQAWSALPGVQVRCEAAGSALLVRSPHLGHDDWHCTDDSATFEDARRFHLLGRMDRTVKLDGKRVALPEVEASLVKHHYVAQAAALVLAGTSRERLATLIALSEAGSAAWADAGRPALVRELRRHLAQFFETTVLPRRWRFCTRLPTDARGKLPAAAVRAAFEVRASGAEVLLQVEHGGLLHYELRVPSTLVHFSGHFPGLPILPGVILIDWAIELASERIREIREVLSIHRLKFMAPVPPGAILQLALAHDMARCSVRFSYRLGERECASGVIEYRERA